MITQKTEQMQKNEMVEACSTHREDETCSKNYGWRAEVKILLWWSTPMLEDNITVVCDVVKWVKFTQDQDRHQNYENTVTNFLSYLLGKPGS
jgi:hypothetical protein